ncbi:hypothetical protein [Actinomadura sp. 9N215]|uniref:hypothetical protein n=1 Tax=Actinomadura sp. 9N215 TaxID=3375150 RepID=UPI003790DB78
MRPGRTSRSSARRSGSTGGGPNSGPAPEAAAHTEEVLLELGHDWTEIGPLKGVGAIA